MARPPQGRLPGTESASDENGAGELPLDLPRVEPRRRRQLFGAPPDARIEPRFNPVNLSEGSAASSPEAKKVVASPPESLGGIAGAEISRDPFAYYAMPRVQSEPVLTRETEPTPSVRADETESSSVSRGAPSAAGRFSAARRFEPSVDISRNDHGSETVEKDESPIDASAVIVDPTVGLSDPIVEQAPIEDDIRPEPRIPSYVERSASTVDRQRFDRPSIDRPSFDRGSLERPSSERMSFERPIFERPLPERSEFDPPVRMPRERPRSLASGDIPPVPADIRVTRTMPSVLQGERERRRDVTGLERTEPRFDSASDEAVTQIDEAVPPLIVERSGEPFSSDRDQAMMPPPTGGDWDQDHAMDALTARMRQRAIDDTERMNAPRSEIVLDQARNAISFFRTKVDEVRVARAEARFKPKVPTVEDLIAQSRVDQLAEEEALIESLYAESPREPLVPKIFKPGFMDRVRFWKRKPVRISPEVQRAQRRKKQSRLYEDIVAWIVVPPFIVGMIYGILELSKIIANSPLGKMLSGQ